MLVTKTDPVGMDLYIQKLQTESHAQLMKKWGLNPADPVQNAKYISYGRCYRNKRNGSFLAEVYTGNAEYKPAYWDDTISAVSFFGNGNNIINGVMDMVDIHWVFFVDLAKLKPSIPHRADEEIRKDVSGLFGKSLQGFSFISFDLWLENVLREYPGSLRDERLKAVDMQPVHCFRLNLKLIYDSNKTC